MKGWLRALLVIALCFAANPARAEGAAQADGRDYAAFSSLPILHGGRVKPLEAFARLSLAQYAGREKLPGMTAATWLAEALFDPAQAAARDVFHIREPALRALLDLAEKDLYALTDLQPGLVKTQEQVQALLKAERGSLEPGQLALLELHENALSYTALLRSLSMVLPLEIEAPPAYANTPGGPLTYKQAMNILPRALEKLKSLIAAKGEDPAFYDGDEQKLAHFVYSLQVLGAGGTSSTELRILPAETGGAWLSPWALTSSAPQEEAPEARAYLDLWAGMAGAWRADNPAAWAAAARKTADYAAEHYGTLYDARLFDIERIYLEYNPFAIAAILYALAVLGLLTALRWPHMGTSALAALAAGTFVHVTALGARIVILQRPPVGTLHESVLFVSLVCAVLGLMAGRRPAERGPALAGAAAAILLLAIAPSLAQDGEGMGMLAAVLNTNFWLATHVLCITAGYGACILSACTAHLYMLQRLRGGAATAAGLQQSAYHFSLAALMLTAIGTVLGGIWADQSWGRFWGWDPKENGALLIVLWLTWAQHGRVSGRLRPLPFIAILALLNIIVALAWFGVNLLNVGLHSYGFVSGVAAALAAFCVIEIMIIGGLFAAIRLREAKIHET